MYVDKILIVLLRWKHMFFSANKHLERFAVSAMRYDTFNDTLNIRNQNCNLFLSKHPNHVDCSNVYSAEEWFKGQQRGIHKLHC